jgi:uncharacterized protein with HEPN domain
VVKDDNLFLGHMLDLASRAAGKVNGLTRAVFDADEDLQMALAHMIQMIGEAAGRVSSQTQTANQHVPWPEIIGMRHRIVHDYMNVDYDIVWEVATRKPPGLVEQLHPIVLPDTSN